MDYNITKKFLIRSDKMPVTQKKKFKLNRLIIAVAICIVAVVLIRQQLVINSYNKKIADLKSEIKTEEKRTKEIEKKAALYSSDEYIEKVAREELGLVKPDEKVFVDS